MFYVERFELILGSTDTKCQKIKDKVTINGGNWIKKCCLYCLGTMDPVECEE